MAGRRQGSMIEATVSWSMDSRSRFGVAESEEVKFFFLLRMLRQPTLRVLQLVMEGAAHTSDTFPCVCAALAQDGSSAAPDIYHCTDSAAVVMPAPTEQRMSLSPTLKPPSASVSASGMLALDVLPTC